MNKHILSVMKWLNDKDSVTKAELLKNRHEAEASFNAAYNASLDFGTGAESWVNKYLERTGQDKQEYIEALKVPENQMNKHILLVMKWLNDKDSVTKAELLKNRHEAVDAFAYAAADVADSVAGCIPEYSASAAAGAAVAGGIFGGGVGATERRVNKYFEHSGEDKQEYVKALKVPEKETSPHSTSIFNDEKFVQMIELKGSVFVATEKNLWMQVDYTNVFERVNFVVPDGSKPNE